MTIELTDQEIKFISEALAFSVIAGVQVTLDQSRDFKALRMKIDSALLIVAMEEK